MTHPSVVPTPVTENYEARGARGTLSTFCLFQQTRLNFVAMQNQHTLALTGSFLIKLDTLMSTVKSSFSIVCVQGEWPGRVHIAGKCVASVHPGTQIHARVFHNKVPLIRLQTRTQAQDTPSFDAQFRANANMCVFVLHVANQSLSSNF